MYCRIIHMLYLNDILNVAHKLHIGSTLDYLEF